MATDTVLVVGVGVAGEAAARRLAEHDWTVTALDEAPVAPARAELLRSRGVRVVDEVGANDAAHFVEDATLVVPSPGVPWSHPALVEARRLGVLCWSEFELAAQWSDLPMVGVTGTNGKTTVTELVTRMLRASGMRTVAAGNTELPLVDAVAPSAGGEVDLDVVVVEASSFRLQFTETWRPSVGTWLNVAEDHLDWHPTMAHYIAAKTRLWAAQEPSDVALANAEDPIVSEAARSAPGRVGTFGIDAGDWRVVENALTDPSGAVVLDIADLWRRYPHDVVDALAAAATAHEAGADRAAVIDVLATFDGLPHRVRMVGEHGGVRYVDDSKATDPHASIAAISSFDSVVLIAGGRNKGLDLSALASTTDRLRAVVAVGEAADEVVDVFAGRRPVVVARSMDDAVAAAQAAAQPGDVVLLSPGCASFDWYGSYAERGDDFIRAVHQIVGGDR